ncbi:SDR family NAD(P)-dependent oxidoreductase [Pseudonocardia sp.]|uniref:SDR family NAD(P)-dependent oxidoreductase n=1 Tax=Pseudonocardia sp. TaxID=60912 RepID=UPI00260D725D|nr:SDR family NAD(P)-dependent oxidoreductase [Pseudonocardia sp.]
MDGTVMTGTGIGRLAGKVALVTGGGSGIGQASALRFAAEGAAVAVLDLREEAAAETAALIAKQDGQAIALAADVSNAAQVEEAVTRAVTEFGRLDVLYNNAGVDSRGSVAVAEEDNWDLSFAVNAKGTFLCSRAALRHMDPAEGETASIINQGSVAGLVGVPNFAAYCAAKGAVIALTRSMAVDLAPRRVRVNVICPGTVFTPLMEPMLRARGDGDMAAGLAKTLVKYPIGRLGTPEEIANVALFLASDEASFMTGAVVTADGGMTAQ